MDYMLPSLPPPGGGRRLPGDRRTGRPGSLAHHCLYLAVIGPQLLKPRIHSVRSFRFSDNCFYRFLFQLL